MYFRSRGRDHSPRTLVDRAMVADDMGGRGTVSLLPPACLGIKIMSQCDLHSPPGPRVAAVLTESKDSCLVRSTFVSAGPQV